MAQTALRLYLRRAYSLSTAFLHHSPAAAAANSHTPLKSSAVPRRNFHSSLSLAFAAAPRSFDDFDKIDPIELFEGCDYNHWLIVMDFGKDPTQLPPPQQMVETYVQTAAQVLGSVEEAKRKIYACSTTVYIGFQVEVDEETSKKFEGLPGVIFVLPDSYIDPVNKEYGGDKYINGEIIPRPPPLHYVRRNSCYKSNDQTPSAPNQPEPMPQPQNFSPQQNHSRGTQTGFNQDNGCGYFELKDESRSFNNESKIPMMDDAYEIKKLEEKMMRLKTKNEKLKNEVFELKQKVENHVKCEKFVMKLLTGSWAFFAICWMVKNGV